MGNSGQPCSRCRSCLPQRRGSMELQQNLVGRPRNDSQTSVQERAEARVGILQVSGRYHTQPRQMEHDYAVQQQELGEGLNGSVFAATSKTTGKKYAVKAVPIKGVAPQIRAENEREAEILLGLDHPYIVRVADIYETEEHLNIVMERMEGGELFDKLTHKRNKRFPEKEASLAVKQMLLAVSYIHDKGIAHRDIKLENFMYDRNGDFLKLIDFGFGHFCSKKRMTENCGTLHYIAPEVLKGPYPKACELGSLGVVAFILLSGYMPFSGSEDKVLSHIRAGKVHWKADIWQTVSAEGRDFVSRMLEVNPGNRLTAKQALRHRWITKNNPPKASCGLDKTMFDALCSHAALTPYRRACMAAMVWALNDQDVAKVREVFLELDRSHQGTVNLRELEEVLRSNFKASDAQIRVLFHALDVSRDGVVRYSEFVAAMCNCPKNVALGENHMQEMFRRLDKNATGVITREEASEVLGLPPAEIEALFHRADKARDGVISYKELVAFMTDRSKSSPMTYQGRKSAPTTCPKGHPLVPYETPSGKCNGCGGRLAAGSKVMDCRMCNYRLCETCSCAKRRSVSQ